LCLLKNAEKVNDSDLEYHQNILFKLKQCEKDSNKYLYIYNKIFDQNQELRTKINEVRKECL
jgi:hypothetical protein